MDISNITDAGAKRAPPLTALGQITLVFQGGGALHKMRHVISSLADTVPPEVANTAAVRDLAAHGCKTRMHVVRPLAPRLKNDALTKDVDISPKGIEARWKAGCADTRETFAARPWDAEHDPDKGFVLYDAAERDLALVMEE